MDKRGYEGLQAVVFMVGVYEGVLPFVCRIFDWRPFLVFPARLPSPAWWIVSAGAIVLCAALLDMLDRAAKRAER